MEGRPGELKQGIESLTKREFSVLRLVAKGYDNLEIAAELSISLNYVRHLMKEIYFKLEYYKRSHAKRVKLALYAIEILKKIDA